MPKEFFLHCDSNQKFVFEFTFENNAETDCNDDISYKIYRNDQPEETASWKGCLSTKESQSFQLLYSDGINIKGELKLYTNSRTAQKFIWLDAYYCLDYHQHFEGAIVKIDASNSL